MRGGAKSDKEAVFNFKHKLSNEQILYRLQLHLFCNLIMSLNVSALLTF